MPQVDLPLEELYAYRGISPRPDDFDRFWDDALRELDAFSDAPGFQAEYQKAAFSVPGFESSDLFFDGIGGARVHARCIIPKTGSFPRPAVLAFHGYSGRADDWADLLPFAAAGAAVFALDVRGQGGESSDPGGVPGTTLNGHVIRGLEGEPTDLFYRGVFLDTAALARIVMGRPDVDEGRVGTFGASQGGALSLVCAALEPRITRAFSLYPFLSDYRRVWDLDLGEDAYRELKNFFRRFDPRHAREDEIFTRLGYIDIQYLAPRIRASVIMAMGLVDEICPPSTQMATYNRIQSDKELMVYPDFSHEKLPEARDRAVLFLCRCADAATGGGS